MKRIFTIALIAGLAWGNAMARQLTPTEALSRLQSVSASKGIGSFAANAYKLAYSSYRNGSSTYYAFNKAQNGGFIVLSADDCMPAVLVESDGNGTFDIDNMPENMRWWMSQYDRMVSEYVVQGKTHPSTVTSYTAISPLLGNTQWSQDEPYNNMCPQHDGHTGLTGCVATAMAQIMRKWQYPERGQGSKSYDYKFEYVTKNGDKKDTTYVDKTVSNDFSTHLYDWQNMLDTYSSNTPGTQVEQDAIAQLMFDCGTASNMWYGNYQSGTADAYATAGLVDYFCYDASITCLSRTLYTDTEWEEMIYNELSQGRPILYGGNDSDKGGHEFVCDGYSNGRFHMNWGWNGSCNCYVLLTSSSKATPTIAATEEDGSVYASFNLYQTACINIKPDEGGALSDEIKMVSDGDYTTCSYNMEKDALEATSTFERTDQMYLNGNFYNACYRTRQYALGIKASNSSATYYMTAGEQAFGTLDGYSAYGTDLADILSAGTYTITPIYKDLTAGDTEWKEMKMRSDIAKPTITITAFTNKTKPYMQITEMPVISTNGGKTTTEDNQVLKSNGKVDLSISVKVKAVNAINATQYHRIYAYIYDMETGKFKSCLYYNFEKALEKSASRTCAVNNRFTNLNLDDSLEVGHQYIVEFADVYIPTSTTRPTSSSSTSQTIPDSQYQNIVFSVVDKIATGVENIAADDPAGKKQPATKKVLRNGQFIIIRNGKCYSIDGKEL